MGWLRLMRPGSVIGEQQGFLCTVQRIREEKAAARRIALLAGHSHSSPDVLGLAAQDRGRVTPASADVRRVSSGPAAPWAAAADAAAAETAAREQAAQMAAGQVAGALDRQSAARMRTWRASSDGSS
jgi:hypothetical protein